MPSGAVAKRGAAVANSWSTPSAGTITRPVRDLVRYFRANPQVFVLLVICVVFGLGTAIIVLYGIVSSGSTTTTGEPDGLLLLHLLAV